MNLKNEIINIGSQSSPAIMPPYQYNKGKQLFTLAIYALTYIALSTVIAFAVIVPIVPGNTSVKAILIPATAYLLIGTLFSIFLYTKLDFLDKLKLNSGLGYTFIVFIGIFSAILGAGSIKGKDSNSITTCFFYSSLFLIPSVINQTWIFYKSLFVTNNRKTWYLPEQNNHITTATVFLNSIRIIIKIAPTPGAAEKLFEATVPGRLSLGNIFNNFIYDEEANSGEKFVTKDENDQIYGWEFLKPSFLGIVKLPIDADLSLNDNNIKANAVILARRVKANSRSYIQLST